MRTALITFLNGRFRQTTSWISVNELKARLSAAASPVVIDVRGPEEFVGPLGHIPGAINLPLDALEVRLNEVAAVAPRGIVFVCKTDKRSEKAAAMLRAREIRNVLVLRGGMEEWIRQAEAMKTASSGS
jgi:rhodanese-related sulfurtransferase